MRERYSLEIVGQGRFRGQDDERPVQLTKAKTCQ